MKVKNVSLVFLRTVVSQTLGLVRSFLVVPFLTIADYGLYRYVVSVFTYANYFNLGTVALLGFKYPFYDASGNVAEARKIQHLVRTTVIIGCFAFLGFLIIFYFNNERFSLFEKGLLVAVGCFLSLVPYFSMFYRTRFEYEKMVRRDLLVAVLSFVVFVVFGLSWGLVGFILGYASIGIIGLAINWRTLMMPAYELEGSFVKSNLNYSLLLAVSGTINQFMINGDLLLIKTTSILSSEEFGIYAFCAMIATLVPSYMGSLSDVNTQELMRFLGNKSTEEAEVSQSNRAIIDRLERILLRDFIIAIGFASIVFIIANSVVLFFFQKYFNALEVLGAFMVGSVVLRWRTYPVVFMNHLEKTSLVNLSSFIAVAFMVGFVYSARVLGFASIYGLAWVSFLSYFICSIFSIFSIFNYYDHVHRFFPFLKRLLIMLIPCVLLASAYIIPSSHIYVFNVISACSVVLSTLVLLRVSDPDMYKDVIEIINNIYKSVLSKIKKLTKF